MGIVIAALLLFLIFVLAVSSIKVVRQAISTRSSASASSPPPRSRGSPCLCRSSTGSAAR